MSEVDNAVPSEVPAGTSAPESDEIIEESSASQDDATETPEEKKLSGVAKRIKELTQLRYEADERARRAEARADQLLQQRIQPEPPPELPKGKPNVAEFTSYEEYTEALADWKVDQKFVQREKEAEVHRAQYEAMTRREAFEAKARAFAAEAPDFNRVALREDLPISVAMAEAIQGSDMGPALLYHLGQNPQLAAQISTMNAYQAAMRLGRLEAEISQPKPNRNSAAPPPIDPVGGGHEGPTTDIYNPRLTDQQYYAMRAQQRKNR